MRSRTLDLSTFLPYFGATAVAWYCLALLGAAESCHTSQGTRCSINDISSDDAWASLAQGLIIAIMVLPAVKLIAFFGKRLVEQPVTVAKLAVLRRYSIDIDTTYPHLREVIPDHQETKRLDQAESEYKNLAEFAWILMIGSVFVAVVTASQSSALRYSLFVVPVGIAMVGIAALVVAREQAGLFSKRMQVAYDLHRFELVDALFLERPSDPLTEKAIFLQMSRFLSEGIIRYDDTLETSAHKAIPILQVGSYAQIETMYRQAVRDKDGPPVVTLSNHYVHATNSNVATLSGKGGIEMSNPQSGAGDHTSVGRDAIGSNVGKDNTLLISASQVGVQGSSLQSAATELAEAVEGLVNSLNDRIQALGTSAQAKEILDEAKKAQPDKSFLKKAASALKTVAEAAGAAGVPVVGAIGKLFDALGITEAD